MAWLLMDCLVSEIDYAMLCGNDINFFAIGSTSDQVAAGV